MSLRAYQSSSYPYQQHNHFSLLRATFYCCLWATMCRTNFLFSASFPSPAQKDNNKNPLRAPWRELNPSLAFRNSATTLNKVVSCHLSTHSSPEINPSCKLVCFFFLRAVLKPRSHGIKDCRYTRVRLLREPHFHIFCFIRFKLQLSKGCRYIFATNCLVLSLRFTLVQL